MLIPVYLFQRAGGRNIGAAGFLLVREKIEDGNPGVAIRVLLQLAQPFIQKILYILIRLNPVIGKAGSIPDSIMVAG